MNQYSETNQAFLLSQMPEATEVKSFKAWSAEGRRIIKGSKALHVWVPKAKKADPDTKPGEMSDKDLRTYFRMGNVFDVSQTETQAEWEARKLAAEQAAEQDAQVAS